MMDITEKLLRNEIHYLGEDLRAVSEELVVLQRFIKQEFREKFAAFRTKLEKEEESMKAEKGTTNGRRTSISQFSSHGPPSQRENNSRLSTPVQTQGQSVNVNKISTNASSVSKSGPSQNSPITLTLPPFEDELDPVSSGGENGADGISDISDGDSDLESFDESPTKINIISLISESKIDPSAADVVIPIIAETKSILKVESSSSKSSAISPKRKRVIQKSTARKSTGGISRSKLSLKRPRCILNSKNNECDKNFVRRHEEFGVRYGKTDKGEEKLIFNNNAYSLIKTVESGRKYWICVNKICPGRLIQEVDGRPIESMEHLPNESSPVAPVSQNIIEEEGSIIAKTDILDMDTDEVSTAELC